MLQALKVLVSVDGHELAVEYSCLFDKSQHLRLLFFIQELTFCEESFDANPDQQPLLTFLGSVGLGVKGMTAQAERRISADTQAGVPPDSVCALEERPGFQGQRFDTLSRDHLRKHSTSFEGRRSYFWAQISCLRLDVRVLSLRM